MRKLKYLSAFLLSAIALTACEDDLAVINPDPGQLSTVPEETVGFVGRVESEHTPGTDIVIIRYQRNDGSPAITDNVKFVLPTPRTEDMTVRIGLEPDYANNVILPGGGSYPGSVAMSFRKKTHLWVCEPQQSNSLIFNGSTEAIVVIKAGEIESQAVELFFDRSKIQSSEAVLFPVRATDLASGELLAETNYVIDPISFDTEVRGSKDAVFVGYIDTEVMSPLIGDKFIYNLSKDDYITGEHTEIYNGPMFDIINVRTAFIKSDGGLPRLDYTADMLYVLKNNTKYIRPLQKSGVKVCLVIKGGGSGLGFSNMTDTQIAGFTAQVKASVDLYGLDGINLWDEGAGYDKEGAQAVSGVAYAKLIKALKEAMPDKILTLVDTRETTEALCDQQDGIRAGDYLDYAWSSLEDFLAPYEPDALTRPIAGMAEQKYGTIFARDPMMMPEDVMMGLESHPVIGELMSMMRFTPLSGTHVMAIYDIPYCDYGKEGVWSGFGMIYEACRYPAPEDFSWYIMGMVDQPQSMRDYYAFKKDW